MWFLNRQTTAPVMTSVQHHKRSHHHHCHRHRHRCRRLDLATRDRSAVAAGTQPLPRHVSRPTGWGGGCRMGWKEGAEEEEEGGSGKGEWEGDGWREENINRKSIGIINDTQTTPKESVGTSCQSASIRKCHLQFSKLIILENMYLQYAYFQIRGKNSTILPSIYFLSVNDQICYEVFSCRILPLTSALIRSWS